MRDSTLSASMPKSTVTKEGSNTRSIADSSPVPGARNASVQVDPIFDYRAINRLTHILVEIARKTPVNSESTLASGPDNKNE
jgi:hypothetical protein